MLSFGESVSMTPVPLFCKEAGQVFESDCRAASQHHQIYSARSP